MARPPKALAQVEGHLTKAQRETRENAEKQLSSNEKIEMSAAVKKSKVAKDLFKRVTGLLDSIGMDDAFYEPVINRYCVMTAECETLEHDLQRTEELLDTLEDRREDMEFTDYVQYAGQLMATKQKITAGLDKKRAMLLQIEKENVMTVMGKLRAVPKKAPEEELEEDPMLGQAKQKLELEKQGIEQSQQSIDKYAVKLEEAKKKLEALQSTKTEFLTAEQAKKVDLYTNAVHNYTVEAERLKTREAEIRQAMDSSAGGAEKYRAELNACQIAIKVNNEHLEEYSKKLEDAKRGGEASAGSVKAYKDAVENAEKEVAKYEASHEAAKDALNRHSVAANKAEANVTRLEKELEQTGQYLDEAKNSADGCATSIDGMGKAVKDTGEKTEKMGQKTSDAMDALASALAAAGVKEALEKIKDALKACTDSSIEFESAMAGVAKTSNMSAAELDAMSQSILDMSKTIPMTTTELAGIAEVGGQLGIAKEDLAGFTEVMAQLGTATNMTSEEAATMLAQFATVTGMDASLYSNLGSAIVDLGNNFATNEKKITDMAQSIAAAGTNAGMSEADMLALSAAVTSVGIEAGAGGTSMATLIQKMQLAIETGNGLEEWAAAAGMSAQEFAALWGKDATGALTAFIQSLGTTEESAMSTLVALGLNDSRLVRMVTSLNSAEQKNHLLSSAIRTANTAWQENTALTNEAATRYATTESKMTLLQNASERLKIAIGNQLRPALNRAAEAGTNLLDWATEYVEANQQLAPLITAVTTGIGVFVGTLTVAAAGIKLVQTVLKALNGTMLASPWGMAALAVAALGTAIATFALTSTREIDKVAENAQKLPDAFEEAQKEISEKSDDIIASTEAAKTLIERLQDMEAKMGDAARDTTEWKAVLGALVETVPELSDQIDLQTGAIEGGTEALLRNVEAWKTLALEQAKQDAMTEYYQQVAEAAKELNGLQYANLDMAIDGTQYKTTVMRFPTLRIPAGGQLVIDSDFFTATLDGENVLDQYEGDWLQFTRELASMSAQSGGSGSLRVSVLYRERYL